MSSSSPQSIQKRLEWLGLGLLMLDAMENNNNPEFNKRHPRNPDGTFKHADSSQSNAAQPASKPTAAELVDSLTKSFEKGLKETGTIDIAKTLKVSNRPVVLGRYGSLDPKGSTPKEIFKSLGVDYGWVEQAIDNYPQAKQTDKLVRDFLGEQLEMAEETLGDVKRQIARKPEESQLYLKAAQAELQIKAIQDRLSDPTMKNHLSDRAAEITELGIDFQKSKNPNEKVLIQRQIAWRLGMIRSEIQYGAIANEITTAPTRAVMKDAYLKLDKALKAGKTGSATIVAMQKYPTASKYYEEAGNMVGDAHYSSGIPKGRGTMAYLESEKGVQQIASYTNLDTKVAFRVHGGTRPYSQTSRRTDPFIALAAAEAGIDPIYVRNSARDKDGDFYNDSSLIGSIHVGVNTGTSAKAPLNFTALQSQAMHEFGHLLEAETGYLDLSGAFVDARAGKDAKPIDMWLEGMPGEMAKPDKFRYSYIGKTYINQPELAQIQNTLASEVVSTGLEAMGSAGLLRGALKGDREHVMYAMSVLEEGPNKKTLNNPPGPAPEPTAQDITQLDSDHAIANLPVVGKYLDRLNKAANGAMVGAYKSPEGKRARYEVSKIIKSVSDSAAQAYLKTNEFIERSIDKLGFEGVGKKLQDMAHKLPMTAVDIGVGIAVGAVGLGAFAAAAAGIEVLTGFSLATGPVAIKVLASFARCIAGGIGSWKILRIVHRQDKFEFNADEAAIDKAKSMEKQLSNEEKLSIHENLPRTAELGKALGLNEQKLNKALTDEKLSGPIEKNLNKIRSSLASAMSKLSSGELSEEEQKNAAEQVKTLVRQVQEAIA